MKKTVCSLFVRTIAFVFIIFSVFGLFMQFVFSYFNQSVNGPKLTIFNFAGPFLITLFILIFAGIRILFQNVLTSKNAFNSVIAIILIILLLSLIIWQAWYIVTLFKIKAGLDFSRKLTEVMPMTIGLFSTLFFLIKTVKRKRTTGAEL